MLGEALAADVAPAYFVHTVSVLVLCVGLVLAAVIDLGFRPRKWQGAVLAALKLFNVVIGHRRSGKTEFAKMLLVDRALRATHPMARFAYVAPLRTQAKGVTWERLKATALRVPGTLVNESELWVQFPNGARVTLYGADAPDSLRGLGLDGVVVDEVGDVERRTWPEVIMPALADRHGWGLFIGTPRGQNLLSELYHTNLSSPNWFVARYDVFQTGVFTAEEIAAIQRECSEAQFRQEFLCDFAASSSDNLNPIDLVMPSVGRAVDPQHVAGAPTLFGVDTAAMGGDVNVVMLRKGPHAEVVFAERGLPEKTLSARIAAEIARRRVDAVFVETNGYGAETASRLRDLGFNVIEVNPGWKASEPERFVNLRSEMHFAVHEWLKAGASIPDSPELIAQLCAPRFTYDNLRGRLQIESKESIRQRIGSSTDYSDALNLTFAFPVAAPGLLGSAGRAVIDWDPFAQDPVAERERARREWS